VLIRHGDEYRKGYKRRDDVFEPVFFGEFDRNKKLFAKRVLKRTDPTLISLLSTKSVYTVPEFNVRLVRLHPMEWEEKRLGNIKSNEFLLGITVEDRYTTLDINARYNIYSSFMKTKERIYKKSVNEKQFVVYYKSCYNNIQVADYVMKLIESLS
jgi:hypothetical protein